MAREPRHGTCTIFGQEEWAMNRRLVFVLLALMALAPAMYAEEWVGWITDDHCGAKGASKEHGSCALNCNKRGAKLVLYNLADKEVYALDDQEAAKKLVGEKVKVTGTKEEGSIKVEKIEKAAEE
jgi:Protein of unknown function (DUF5818)